MNKLECNQIVAIQGGKLSNRSCMILGGISFACFIAGFGAPPAWGVSGGALITAINGGCFDD